jgi:hypothetical protein
LCIVVVDIAQICFARGGLRRGHAQSERRLESSSAS